MMNDIHALKSLVLLATVFLVLVFSISSDGAPRSVPVDSSVGFAASENLRGIEGGGLLGIEGGGIVSAISEDLSKITVNNVIYDASAPNLSVIIDDQPADISHLRVGSAIRFTAIVNGAGGDPELESIETLAELEGPVTAGTIDLVQGDFVVLGQRVEVTENTEFDNELLPGGLQDLTDGILVEIMGLVVEPGVIRASRIELGDSSDELELFGEVFDLDDVNFTFRIGLLEIDYSAAEVDDSDVEDTLQNGDFVEVEGLMLDENGVLIATEIERQNEEFLSEEDWVGDEEGAITRFESAIDFDVAGFPITTNGQTEFEGGVAGDLSLGVAVEVEGSVNADNVLVAEKVEFTDDEAVSSTIEDDWL